jgi:FkbM family methyltransferase
MSDSPAHLPSLKERNTVAVCEPPLSFRLLSALTRMIPAVPHASGISNRIVKPLFCRWHPGDRYRVAVWDDVEMILDPADCIGGNLAFIPQLFDRWERHVIDTYLPRDGVFVDVGANIGAHSLWAAHRVGPEGRVLAYEAEPANFASLKDNIALNRFESIVTPSQVGVADASTTLMLQLNLSGNSGGHSFMAPPDDASDALEVACEPLSKLIDNAGVARIDFIKLDIEGFELRVLSRFFDDVPPGSALRPTAILTEMYFGDERDRPLIAMLDQAGYVLRGSDGLNSLFLKSSTIL